jgi:hypothetical protein
MCDAPANSLTDTIVSPKVKQREKKRIGVHSLIRITLRVKGYVGTMGWGLGRMTSGSIIHINLQKPNNKLVSV